MTTGVLKCGCTSQEVVSLLDELLQLHGSPVGAVSNPRVEGNYLFVDVQGASTVWTIKVDIESSILDQLPSVLLVQPEQLLAHVSYGKIICIDDGQGLSIDTSRIADIYAHVLFDAFNVLEKAAVDATRGSPDLMDEFEGYFEGFPNAVLARTSVEPDTASRLIYGHIENLGKGRQVCWYLSEQSGERPSEFRTANLASFTGLYVALENAVLPPNPGAPLDSAFVERVIDAFGPKERQLWDRLVSRRWMGKTRLACLLVSQPRPSGGRSLIGLTFRLKKGRLDEKGPFSNLVVCRHTPSHMRERGGASNDFAMKHVAILGCGSVGSEIADALASCGVGKLTLVDYDRLEADNVFRHALGKNAIGQNKVDALKVELLRKYPGLTVKTAPRQAAEWMKSGESDRLDAIVLAVGKPSAERSLAKAIRSAEKPLSIVVAWLEPLGLGGHVVVLPSEGPGCLDCLYRSGDGLPSLHPEVSFLEPNQVVSKSLSGCVSTFIPYSALHSRRTALLATEMTISALASFSMVTPSYRFWVGDDTQAVANGIRTSPWYDLAKSTDCSSATQSIFGNPCSHCA